MVNPSFRIELTPDERRGVLQGYVRDADMFRDHAGAGLL